MTALAILAGAWAFSAYRSQAVAVPPRDSEALVRHALDLVTNDQVLLNRDTQQAIRAVSVLVEEAAVQSAEGVFLLGLQYKRERNIEGAEAEFRRAIEMKPDWSWPYHGLGYLLGQYTHGRIDEAIDMLKLAIARDPEWGRPHNSLAVLYRVQGRFEEAEVEAELALKLEPEDFASLNNYANLLKAQQRFEEAEIYYHMAIANMPDHPKPHYNLACLYSQLGNADAALKELQEAFNRADVLRLEAATDPDLDPLRGNARFEAMLRP